MLCKGKIFLSSAHKATVAMRKLVVYLLLCVLWKNVGANDESSAQLWRGPSLLNNNFRLRQIFPPLIAPPPPPTTPPPPPPPPSPPPPPPPPPSPPPFFFPAVLSGFDVSSGTLDPPFNETVFTYTVSVDSSVSELQVSVTVPLDEVVAGYAVSVNGTGVDSGASGPTIELADEGETVTIYVSVGARGYTSSLYTIYVTRAESSSSGSSGGGGLKGWQIALIVVACVVVVALIAGGVYWAYQKGWFSSSSKKPESDYRALP